MQNCIKIPALLITGTIFNTVQFHRQFSSGGTGSQTVSSPKNIHSGNIQFGFRFALGVYIRTPSGLYAIIIIIKYCVRHRGAVTSGGGGGAGPRPPD